MADLNIVRYHRSKPSMGLQHPLKRRRLIQCIGAACALAWLPPSVLGQKASGGGRRDFEPLQKSEEQWRSILSPERFGILREGGTEPPRSSPLNAEKRDGAYVCAGCFLPLFSSAHKFESGTGWPSFTQPIAGAVDTKTEFVLFIPRTEYHCARCNGHQGHVFDDGPPPTGDRWCNNGLALRFVPAGEALPELRQ